MIISSVEGDDCFFWGKEIQYASKIQEKSVCDALPGQSCCGFVCAC